MSKLYLQPCIFQTCPAVLSAGTETVQMGILTFASISVGPNNNFQADPKEYLNLAIPYPRQKKEKHNWTNDE